MITKNLCAVLLQFRRDGHLEPLWVDAVCIDQENPNERSSQVQIMGEIYSTARATLAWLGPRSDDDFQAFPLIRWLDEMLQTIPEFRDNSDRLDIDWKTIYSKLLTTNVMQGLDVDSVTHLAYLFTRSWFQRVWVIQEVIKAKTVIVICGSETLPFDTLNNALAVFHECSFQSFLKPSFRNFDELNSGFTYRIGHFQVLSRADVVDLFNIFGHRTGVPEH
jgi:hypothetical protein